MSKKNSVLNLKNYRYIVHWRKPAQFMQEKPSIFSKETTPFGLSYGTEDKSWFVAALSSLARRPGLIKRMFVNTKYTSHGIYRYYPEII